MGKEKNSTTEPVEKGCHSLFTQIIEALNELRQRQDTLEKCLLDLTERVAESLGLVEAKQAGMLGLILNHVHHTSFTGVGKVDREKLISGTPSDMGEPETTDKSPHND